MVNTVTIYCGSGLEVFVAPQSTLYCHKPISKKQRTHWKNEPGNWLAVQHKYVIVNTKRSCECKIVIAGTKLSLRAKRGNPESCTLNPGLPRFARNDNFKVRLTVIPRSSRGMTIAHHRITGQISFFCTRYSGIINGS